MLAVGVRLLITGPLLALAVVRDEPGMDARDLGVNEWFRSLASSIGALHTAAEWVSWIGSGARTGPIVLGSCVVLLVLRRWRWTVFLFASAEVGYLISDVTKVLVGRDRPPWTHFGALEAGTSFPSGHSFGGLSAWVAMGLVLWFLLPRAWSTVLGSSCWCLGLLNGPARLLVGAHWVTDVAGGLLLGGGWMLVVFGACLWWWAPSRHPERPTP